MNLDWIAGFFDGEGSVSLKVNLTQTQSGFKIQPRIILVQKNPTPLYAIKKYLNMGRIKKRTNLGPRHTSVCQLEIDRYHDCERFAQLLLDHVMTKRRQLEILIEFFRVHRFYHKPSPDELKEQLRLQGELREANGYPKRAVIDSERLLKLHGDWDASVKNEQSSERILLLDLYWKREMSQGQIGKYLGVTRMTVMDRMHQHGIPLRPKSLAVSLGKAAVKREESQPQSAIATDANGI